MSLIDVSSVDIVVDVPESLLARLIGDASVTAVARFDTARGREFDLRLKEQAAQADPRTQTFRITLTMPQPEDINILPGMTATVIGKRAGVEIDQGQQPLTVPAVAVVAGETGQSRVWVFDEASRTVSARPLPVEPVNYASSPRRQAPGSRGAEPASLTQPLPSHLGLSRNLPDPNNFRSIRFCSFKEL